MKRFLFGMIAVTIAAIACRRGEPTGDPKTPPNSPLPKVERTDDDTNGAEPRSPLAKDAG